MHFDRLLVLVLLMFTGQALHAQWTAPCGTDYSDEYMETFYQRDRSHLHGTPKMGPELTMPVFYHLVADDNGNGRFSYNDMLRLHCELNEYFDSLHIRFFIAGWNEIDNTTYYEHAGFGTGTNMFFDHGVPNVCNVFIDDNAAGACGYYSGAWNFIVLRKSCSAENSTTYPHEMGHFLGLPHTFSGWEGRDYFVNPIAVSNWERVDGSNCAFTADGFCDTPPDYESDRWNCSPGPSFTDPDGVDFIPDASYYMSYSSDACQSRFSSDQIAEMRNVLATGRQEPLNDVPAEPNDSVGQATLVAPEPAADYLGADGVVLEWTAAPNATRYLVQLTETNFFNPTIERIVTDTELVLTDLDPDQDYQWRVRPFSLGQTCTGFSLIRAFRTSSIQADITVTDTDCPGDANGAIEVDLLSPFMTAQYRWSSADPALDAQLAGVTLSEVDDLPAGIYQLAVRTDPFDSLNATVVVAEPEEVTIDFTQVSGELLIDPTGGTPPYSVAWANGQFGLLNTAPVVGANDFTISDANGCIFIKSIELETIVTGLRDQALDADALRLYPNPSQGGRVTIEGMQDLEIRSVRVTDTRGRTVPTTTTRGADRVVLEMGAVSGGIYLVHVETDRGQAVRKLVVR
mgnify:CR=1 FL=1